MELDISQRQQTYLCLGIAALLWLTYSVSLANEFVALDDNLLILKNSLVQHMSPFTLRRVFTSYDPELYIPFTLLLYQILYAIAGPNPVIFHAANLVLHTANTMLVVWILTQLLRKRWLGVLGGALFALHPMHTEAVVWASATKDLLSALFSLFSLGLYLHFLTSEDRKFFRYSLFAFVCSLFSKVVPIALPLVLLLADRAYGRPLSRKVLLEKKWFFVWSFLFGIIAVAGKSQNPQLLGITERVLMACKSMTFFLEKLLVPTGLSVLHPQLTPITVAHTEFLLPVAVTIGVLALLGWSYRYAQHLCLGTGMFVLFLAPNFSTFSKNGYLFFASERYAYLPSVGLLLLLLLGIKRYAERPRAKRAAVVAVCCVIPVFAVLSYQQSLTWKDTEHMYRNVLVLYPTSAMALTNLGGALADTGRKEEALALFTQAYEQDGNSIAAGNIGLIALKAGEVSAAQEWFTKAIESIPSHRALTAQDMVAYYLLADTLEGIGKSDDALTLYKEAAERGAALAEPHINLGIAYRKRGMRTEAEAAFRAAMEQNSRLPAPHYHLAGILAETGYLPEAISELRTVLRLEPNYENARRHLQSILQMSPTR